MTKIIPSGKSGEFSITKQRITKQEVKNARMRQIWHHDEIVPKIGIATVLGQKSNRSWKNQEVIMSDTEFEKYTNENFLRHAHGNILIAGLGIGLIILPLLKDKDVKKITVVEKEQDVINLVYKHIKKLDKKNKMEVIHDDILTLNLPKEKKFDVIYFDIWNNVCGDNYSVMKMLRKRFRKNTVTNGYLRSWEETNTKRQDI